MSESPAITVMLDYTTPYAKFVDYTNRKEATEVEINQEIEERLVEGVSQETANKISKEVPEQNLDYVGYIDYMKRSYATKEDSAEKTGIFTSNTLNADIEEAKNIKNMLQKARSNNSILWRGVISFDNDFLAQNGLYDPKTKKVDQVGIKKAIQKAMPNVISREKLSDSAFWWGNIHLNTDNVHVHIGISEIESARPTFFYEARHRKERKGKFEQKTLKGIKSQVYNALLKEKSRDQNLRKEQLLANLREKLLNKIGNQEVSKLDELERFYVEQALNHLPESKRLRYGSNAKDFQISKFFIDRYLERELEKSNDFEKYKVETEKLLEDRKQAYTKADNNDMQQFVDQRIDDLKERLGNRTLKYLKGIKPQDLLENQSNIEKFSKFNQRAIHTRDPEATLIHSEKMWKKLGYQIDKDKAKEIKVNVPVKNKSEQDKLGSKFKEEKFFDVRFVTANNRQNNLDLKMLTAMTKDDLNELIKISQGIAKTRPEDKKLRQEVGIFKYALKQKMLQERSRELGTIKKLLGNYQNPVESDKLFLNYKQQQIKELQELVKLQQTPKSKLSKNEQVKKLKLQNKYLDQVQVPIKKVDEKVYQNQVMLLTEERKLTRQVEDQSIFQIIKGEKETKNGYIDELDTKIGIITAKYKINHNNKLIKKSNNPDEKKQYRQENGKYFQDLKKSYQKLNPSEEKETNIDFEKLANSLKVENELRWDYPHDSTFRKKVSQKSDQQRHNHQLRIKGNFKPVSKDLAKGISLITRDDTTKKAQLLRQKARDDREEEKERSI